MRKSFFGSKFVAYCPNYFKYRQQYSSCVRRSACTAHPLVSLLFQSGRKRRVTVGYVAKRLETLTTCNIVFVYTFTSVCLTVEDDFFFCWQI